MTHPSETAQTATIQIAASPAPGHFVHESPDQAAKMICDLSQANAFIEEYRKPHVPIMSAFGGGRLHVCRLQGSWDLDRMAADFPSNLFRSIRKLPSKDAKQAKVELDDLTFQMNPRLFIYADANRIVGFAAHPEEAERWVEEFRLKYQKPKPTEAEAGVFSLIQYDGIEIKTRQVDLLPGSILTPDDFSLHYGKGCLAWHQNYVQRLLEKPNGLTILEGKPGTGKTSYLRHLIGVLKESHRFYFIPTASMSILSRPDFIGFWADQRQYYSDKKFAVVLEDSDTALMTRGSDNREEVSAILNLSDGMLADFLRLQIICTINCSSTDIDPALLRPGRLLCHRVFERLDYRQASLLADRLGRKLPQPRDYSLAEIFADQNDYEVKPQRMGFAN